MNTLEKAILTVSKELSIVYTHHLISTDNPSEAEKIEARKQFNDAVVDTFLTAFSDEDTPIGTRFRIKGHLHSPEKCGYPLSIDIEKEGLSAGAIYAIWFYATTGNKADYDTCLNLDIAQNQLLDSALFPNNNTYTKKSSSWPYLVLMLIIGIVIGIIIYGNS